MKKNLLILLLFQFLCVILHAQQVTLTPDQIKPFYARNGKANDLPMDGLLLTDKLPERLANIRLEEALGRFTVTKGYLNQFEGDSMVIYPDSDMTGRVVTAQYRRFVHDVDKL